MSKPPVVPVLSAAEAAAWDARARPDVPARVLMESAGRAAAVVLADRFRDRLSDGVLVATGPGNNGGDGWVLARALAAVGVPVSAVEIEHPRSEGCEVNRTLALAHGVTLRVADEPWPAMGVVVDALLGTGASGAPRGAIGALAHAIAAHGVPVCAIDGPTGLDLTTGEAHGPVRAAVTVTFGSLRRGQLLQRDWCGEIVALDIGFPAPEPAWPALVTDRWARTALPAITSTMHKGNRGRLLVVGGAAGMAGAAIHAGRAAFQAGAGLVKLAVQPESVEPAQAQLPDALTVTTALGPEIESALAEALAWADAVAIGPGMGRTRERVAFVSALLTTVQKPVVLDADALQVGADVLARGTAPRVLTPHPGEFAALFPTLASRPAADRFAAAGEGITALDAHAPTALVLKGVPTVIADRDGAVRIVASGNAGLATGGSGDLLTGVIGILLARGLSPIDAAALGAQTLGRGAERAAEVVPVRAMRPEDVAAQFPALWRAWAAPDVPRPPELVALAPPATA